MDIKFVNVLILGFGFMFVFTSFQTMGNIEVSFLLFVFIISILYCFNIIIQLSSIEYKKNTVLPQLTPPLKTLEFSPRAL